MRLLTSTVLGFAVVATIAAQAPDALLSDTRLTVHTLVREDVFAGFRGDNMERLERAERNIEIFPSHGSHGQHGSFWPRITRTARISLRGKPPFADVSV